MTAAVIVISKKGFTAYGAARDAFYDTSPEIMLSGPYDTGKTLTLLHKLNVLLGMFPRSRALMTRKTYTSLKSSCVITWDKKIHCNQFDENPGVYPIKKIGGENPQAYIYPNGSRLDLGGMDNPAKTLSTEYDYIYVNQAEELNEDEWQALTRAASGRSGNTPYTQVMGDCNPDVPGHWILTRKRIRLYESRHEDNPTIFERDDDGQPTGNYAPGGRGRIEALDAMTGVRYKRGRLGLWVGREGQVYENFDPAIHVLDRFDIPPAWPRYRSIDFGYTNPFSCSWWALDNDGRLYRYRQIYMSGRTVKVHAAQINELSKGERISATVADHDAEDRATLRENGIMTIAADKRISVGIEKIEERLKKAGDGKPRIFFLRDSLVEVDQSLKDKRHPLDTVDEFASYVWPEAKDGRPIKEVPVDMFNHGLDETRYMVMHFDAAIKPQKPQQSTSMIMTG